MSYGQTILKTIYCFTALNASSTYFIIPKHEEFTIDIDVKKSVELPTTIWDSSTLLKSLV